MARDGKDDEGEAAEGGAERYGEELLSANWNPVLALLEWSCARTASEVARSNKPDVSEDDIDAFLTRIYTSGA